MKKVSIAGVLIGGAVDLGASFLGAAILFIFLSITIGFEQIPKAQVHPTLSRMLHESWMVHATELFAGFACTALGGYVAASIAKHNFLLNGTLASVTCMLLDVYWIYSGKDHHSLLVRLCIFAVTPTMGLLGGYLKAVRTVGKANQVSTAG